MTQSKLGRPPKAPQKRKRLQYSVWVSAEEKQQIDKLIEQSNLSASQFFLSQVIDKPIQRPKKKSLPKAIVEHIVHLEKLSGLLALSVLKTKDKPMVADNWLKSSQNIKWITQLIALRVFEDFDFPSLKSTLINIVTNTETLYQYLDKMLGGINREKILNTVSQLYHQSKNLLNSFEAHYETKETPPRFRQLWHEDFDIHQEIINIKNELQKP